MMRYDPRNRLQTLAQSGTLRQRRVVEGPQQRKMHVDGIPLLAFASNDYLGLANHPDLIAAAHAALDHYGVGAGASALISGHSVPVAELELALARWLGFERCLHFSTGYMANLGILPALIGRDAAVFSDALNHACLIDGIRLASPQSLTIYPHGDVEHLQRALSNCPAGEKWIVTDAVFSMDGDMAPLPALVALADQHDAMLIVDDAHGFGVLGEEGRGSLAHHAIHSGRVLYMATLGKAAGVFGAFVGGSYDLIEWLMQRSRTYIFTTGTPPVLAAACLASLQHIRQDQFRRNRLSQLARQLQDGARDLPWALLPSRTAIHPLMLGDNTTVMRIAKGLQDRGLWVPAIRPPTVPPGSARLRISLSALHLPQDVTYLLDALKELA